MDFSARESLAPLKTMSAIVASIKEYAIRESFVINAALR
jgi:hypothetical protein